MAGPTRWGICGTGRIAHDFCRSVKWLPPSEHQITAVASRDKKKAEKFASQFGIPKSYGSYEDLAQASDIDVVYIATISTLHVENSLMFIEAGKNVLCEKPMAMSLKGCQSVLSAAKQKGVLFMEGFWTRFFPATRFVVEHVKSGGIGDVKMVHSTIAMVLNLQRSKDPNLGASALMALGAYCVQAANLIFKGKPQRIVADCHKLEEGSGLVDRSGVALLKYPGGKFATCAFSEEASRGANSWTIHGTKGNICVPGRFWCPTEVHLSGGEIKTFDLPKVQGDYNTENAEGFCYEAQCFHECLLQGQTECPIMSHEDSETIMSILQEMKDQL